MRYDRVFTPENYRKIQLWVSQRVPIGTICRRLGVTEGSLKVKCSREGISLRAGKALPHGFRVGGEEEREVAVKVTGRALEDLNQYADSRGMSVEKVISQILNTIAADDLYSAVLDDE